MSPVPEEDRVLLEPGQVESAGLEGWRLEGDVLRIRLATGDFVTGVRLIQRIAEEAERADHHPDVDLRYPHVDIVLSSHDVGGVTRRDVRLARVISAIARENDVEAAR